MSWLWKACQVKSPPPTYVGVGHGYHWDGERLREQWETGRSWSSLLWWYDNSTGQIVSEPRTRNNSAHWLDGAVAKGRIDVEEQIGSITFESSGDVGWEYKLQEQIIDKVQKKWPQVTFYVYARGGPYSVPEYIAQLYRGQQ